MKTFLKVGLTCSIFLISLISTILTNNISLLSVTITVGLLSCTIGDFFMDRERLVPGLVSFSTAYLLYSIGFIFTYDFSDYWIILISTFMILILIAIKFILPNFQTDGALSVIVPVLTVVEMILFTTALGSLLANQSGPTLLFTLGSIGILICDTIVGFLHFSKIESNIFLARLVLFICWYGGLLALAVGNILS